MVFFAVTAGVLPNATKAETRDRLIAQGTIPADAFCSSGNGYTFVQTLKTRPTSNPFVPQILDKVLADWFWWLIAVAAGVLVLALTWRIWSNRTNDTAPPKSDLLQWRSAVAHLNPTNRKGRSLTSRTLPKFSLCLSLLASVVSAGAFMMAFWEPSRSRYFDGAWWFGLTWVGMAVAGVTYMILRGTFVKRASGLAIAAVALATLIYFNGTTPHLNARTYQLATMLGVTERTLADNGIKPAVLEASAPSVSEPMRFDPPTPAQLRTRLDESLMRGQKILLAARSDTNKMINRHCTQYKGRELTAGVAIDLADVEHNLSRLETFGDCVQREAHMQVDGMQERFAQAVYGYQFDARALGIAKDNDALKLLSAAQLRGFVIGSTIKKEADSFEAFAKRELPRIQQRAAQEAANRARNREMFLKLARRGQEAQLRIDQNLQTTLSPYGSLSQSPHKFVPMTDAQADQILSQTNALTLSSTAFSDAHTAPAATAMVEQPSQEPENREYKNCYGDTFGSLDALRADSKRRVAKAKAEGSSMVCME